MTGSLAVRGIAIPVGVLLVAVRVFLSAGDNQSFGPLDLATADWLSAAIWSVAPVAGGFASRGSDARPLRSAATILGATVGLGVAFVLLAAAGTATTCQVGDPSSSIGYFGGCLLVGAIAGIGMGASVYLVGRLARRSRYWLPAAVLGIFVSFVTSAAAINLYFASVSCLR